MTEFYKFTLQCNGVWGESMKVSQKLSIALQFSIIRVQLMYFFFNCGLAFQMHFMEIYQDRLILVYS